MQVAGYLALYPLLVLVDLDEVEGHAGVALLLLGVLVAHIVAERYDADEYPALVLIDKHRSARVAVARDHAVSGRAVAAPVGAHRELAVPLLADHALIAHVVGGIVHGEHGLLQLVLHIRQVVVLLGVGAPAHGDHAIALAHALVVRQDARRRRQAYGVDLRSAEVDASAQLEHGYVVHEYPLVEVERVMQVEVLHRVDISVMLLLLLLVIAAVVVVVVVVQADADLHEREYLRYVEVERVDQAEVDHEAVSGGDHVLIAYERTTTMMLTAAAARPVGVGAAAAVG